MPVLFICFILFLLWFRVKSKESDKQDKAAKEEFWQREQEANFTRKKDISNLDYLVVDTDKLPFSSAIDAEEQTIQEDLQKIISKKILNLSGMTNTDIKLAYGRANLDILSEYDQNFMLLLRTLNKWGAYLYKKEEKQRAKQVLEYALSIDSDITETYTTLAKIYLDDNEPQKVQNLIEHAKESNAYMKEAIVSNLINVIQEY